MTVAQIEAKQMQSNVIFDAAKKIRETLDAAREAYGAQEWDDDAKEDETLELVTQVSE